MSGALAEHLAQEPPASLTHDSQAKSGEPDRQGAAPARRVQRNACCLNWGTSGVAHLGSFPRARGTSPTGPECDLPGGVLK